MSKQVFTFSLIREYSFRGLPGLHNFITNGPATSFVPRWESVGFRPGPVVRIHMLGHIVLSAQPWPVPSTQCFKSLVIRKVLITGHGAYQYRLSNWAAQPTAPLLMACCLHSDGDQGLVGRRVLLVWYSPPVGLHWEASVPASAAYETHLGQFAPCGPSTATRRPHLRYPIHMHSTTNWTF